MTLPMDWAGIAVLMSLVVSIIRLNSTITRINVTMEKDAETNKKEHIKYETRLLEQSNNLKEHEGRIIRLEERYEN